MFHSSFAVTFNTSSPNKLNTTLICVVLICYRARIANIDFRNRGFVEVNFIDYGNRDFVPVDNIRSLDFPSSFISIPPLATSFIFAEAHCPGKILTKSNEATVNV